MAHTTAPTADTAALRAAASGKAALCTITAIEGSFSRRLGAQLAVLPDGSAVGSMADGCLEAALIAEAQAAARDGRSRHLQFGGDGDVVDLRLPCGSRISIAVDPAPDRVMIEGAVAALDARTGAEISLPLPGGGIFLRRYRPELRILAAGTGPELDAFERLAAAHGAMLEPLRPHGEAAGAGLALGQAPKVALDGSSAVVVLFHDHEWERTILPWALNSDAFYIGAQGGADARAARGDMLGRLGLADAARGRLHGPVGLIRHARDPAVLALSVLAEVVAAYEAGAPASGPA